MAFAPTESVVVLSWTKIGRGLWQAFHRGHALKIIEYDAPRRFEIEIDGRKMGERASYDAAGAAAATMID